MKKGVSKILIYGLLILFAIFTTGPFLWLLSTSLMPGENVFTFPPKLIPTTLNFTNYTEVLSFLDFGKYILNTVIITALGVGLNVFFSCLTGYPLATYNFKGKNFIFSALIATMIIPASAGMIVNYLTIKRLGLMNSFMGVVLPTAVTVFNVFLMRQAFSTVPLEVREAGKIDGAGEFRIWWNLMLPMVRPAVAVIGLFQFMAHWNEFLWPMIILKDSDKYPLGAALTFLKGQFSYNFGWLSAGTVISVLPIIIIFIICQKQFIEGMAGALKG